MLYILAMPLGRAGVHRGRRSWPSRCSTSLRNPGPHGLTRDPLRLHLGRQQQRLGVRRAHRQHRLVHDHARARDAGRPVLPDHPGPRHRRARWRASRPCRPVAGHVPDRTRRCSPGSSSASSLIVAGLTFFPALALGPIVEQLVHLGVSSMTQTAHHGRPAGEQQWPGPSPAATPVALRPGDHPRRDRATASASSTRGSRPRNPVMFVVDGRQRADHGPLLHASSARRRRAAERLQRPGRRVPVVHRALRQLRRGDGRGAGQGPGRHAAQDAHRDDRQAPYAPTARSRRSPATAAATSATMCVVEAGEVIPGDGDVDRGHRHRRRVGDHRRVGAGDPRVRRRPLGGHRRHPGAVRLDRGPHHGRAGRDASSTA